MATNVSLTGVERFMDPDKFIVSKTDLKGKITYVNRVFLDIAGYDENELLGKPHNIIRNPDMPRCIFKLLWETVQSGHEIFAYVNNKAKFGDNYWVFAHVTPSFDVDGKPTGYHSNRRAPDRNILETVIIPLYNTLLAEETKYQNIQEGMEQSYKLLMKTLKQQGMNYDEFIFSL